MPGCAALLPASAVFGPFSSEATRSSLSIADGRASRGWQARHLNVHHRHSGDHTQLVTLCAGCHACVHRSRILRRWLPEILVDLWREWHPDAVEQLRLPVEMFAGALARGGWQIFPDFPARSVAEPSPEDDPDGGGNYSRIFPGRPAQSTFDWPREAELEGPRAG